MNLGLAITTTPNRRDTLIKCVKNMRLYAPRDLFIFWVENDSSFNGVAYSKNRCLEVLYNAGCEHIFLFDDDCYPIARDWWKPYVESKEPHLLYQYKIPSKPKTDMQVLYEDDEIISYSHTRGAMIYLERRVLDVVGGFDEEYEKYGFEHPDFTNRIHNAGLTTHRAMDVVGSDKLLYCLDQDGKVESSLPSKERQRSLAKNYKLYLKNRDSKEYKEFR